MIDPELGNRDATTIEKLREMVENDEYIYEAIQRIALVLSNEILDYRQGGEYNERYRKGRK